MAGVSTLLRAAVGDGPLRKHLALAHGALTRPVCPWEASMIAKKGAGRLRKFDQSVLSLAQAAPVKTLNGRPRSIMSTVIRSPWHPGYLRRRRSLWWGGLPLCMPHQISSSLVDVLFGVMQASSIATWYRPQ